MARFPRRARLLKPADFQAAFKHGTRINERWLTAVAVPNTQGHARLGIAVAKKIMPLAVDRNRIKRQIRESFRAQQYRLDGTDVVILSRPGCSQAGAAQLTRNLERLWNRVAVLSPPSSSS